MECKDRVKATDFLISNTNEMEMIHCIMIDESSCLDKWRLKDIWDKWSHT